MADINPYIEELRLDSEKKARLLVRKFMDPDISKPTLESLKAGSHKAFDTVFLRYHAPVKRYIAAIIKNEEDSQELTQDVFMRLWEKHDYIDPEKNIRGFLYRTARFFVLDYFKKKKYIRQYEEYSAHLWDFQAAPDQELIEKELQLLAQITIERMPPQRRKIVKMRFMDGKSVEQIATELDIAESTVWSHSRTGQKEIESVLAIYFFFLFMV